MAKSDYKVANLERWKAMHALRSSNAAQPHVPKNLKGTRSSKKKNAINKSIRGE